jgi:hypothetical protein
MGRGYVELLTRRGVLTNNERESESQVIRRAGFEASTIYHDRILYAVLSHYIWIKEYAIVTLR